ncbi:MAG: alginate export family protein [Bdellovibrionales bacterium]
MRRMLATAVLVAFMPTANAQDQGKAEVTHSAEYRARYWFMQNPTLNENTQPGTDSFFNQRFKLGLNYRANEQLMAHATLLHTATWGQTTGVAAVEDTSAATTENLLTVNEAFVNWMTSEDLTFRLGRQNYGFADGFVIGVNDWEPVPYSFEGVLGTYEAEFGRIQAFGFKLRDTQPGAANTSASGDPEHNLYGLVFDLKTMPDWLKVINVHVLKHNNDAILGSAGSTVNGQQGQDILRYGLHAAADFQIVDAKLWYAAQNGDNVDVAAGGATTKRDSKGSMYQAELGLNFPDLMGSRFFAVYHVDSGDEENSTDEDGQYDNFFYERHENAGLMDLFDWGNLTYITVGWTGKVTEATGVGVMYHMFSKTEDGAGTTVTLGRFGTDYAIGNGDAAKDDLGDEIDVWASHTYGNGLMTTARVGYFMPGDVYDNATTNKDDKLLQVMLEAKLTF